MNKLVWIFLILIFSCSKKESSSTVENQFKRLEYSNRIKYSDTIAKKITPDKKYDYWAYVAYKQYYGGSIKDSYKILSQDGDTIYRHYALAKFEFPGFFEGCHPSYCCNYAVIVENKKVKYIKTIEEARTFLGTIDNLEEALLLAKSYGYVIDDNIKASTYKEINNGYIFHLLKFNDSPFLDAQGKEAIEVTVTKEGFIKSRTLGFYCKGSKCL